MQEGVATSSTDVEEQFSDPTEVSKTSKESLSVEQGQPLRAAEPDQCVSKVKAKPIPETPTQQHSYRRFPAVCVYGKDTDDPHRRRQDSKLEDASFVSRRHYSGQQEVEIQSVGESQQWIGRNIERAERRH